MRARSLLVCLTSVAAQYRGYGGYAYGGGQRGNQQPQGRGGGGFQQQGGGGFQQQGGGGFQQSGGGRGGGAIGGARQGGGLGAQQGQQFDPLGRNVPPARGGSGGGGGYLYGGTGGGGYRQGGGGGGYSMYGGMGGGGGGGGGRIGGLRSVQDLPKACRDGLTFDGSGVYMDRGQELPCDYSMTHIGSLDLSYGEFAGVDFSGSNLAGAKFWDSVLDGARFHGANLEGASFEKASVNDVEFERANLKSADFTDALMSQGTSFKDADCTRTTFSGQSRCRGSGGAAASTRAQPLSAAQLAQRGGTYWGSHGGPTAPAPAPGSSWSNVPWNLANPVVSGLSSLYTLWAGPAAVPGAAPQFHGHGAGIGHGAG